MLMGVNIQNELTSAVKGTVDTGYWWLNTIIILFVSSFIMKSMQDLTWMNRVFEKVKELLKSFWYRRGTRQKMFKTVIEQTTTTRSKGDFYTTFMSSNDNVVMHRAILRYLQKKGVLDEQPNSNLYFCCPWENFDGEREALGKSQMMYLPKNQVTCDGVKIKFKIIKQSEEEDENSGNDRINRNGNDKKKKKKKDDGVSVVITTPTSLVCQTFLDACMKGYTDEYYPEDSDDEDDVSFYDLQKPKTSTDDLMFQEYEDYMPLKTFDTLFFPQKTKVLQMLDDFINQKNGFHPGFQRPWRLGIMLHGPAGTGKTSIIKSMARMTKRHVFNIPMTYVKTATHLIQLFRSERIKVPYSGYNDDYRTSTIPFKRRMYVFEDVDTESKIFKNRKKGKKDEEKADDEDITNKAMMQKIKMATMAAAAAAAKGNDKEQGPASYSFSTEDDPISLGTFLNCMDGLVETQGIIYIFTTNCIDEFDPAFVREGRIHLKILMDYSTKQDIVNIVNHNFSVITKINEEEKKEAVEFRILNPEDITTDFDKFTGAKIENICQQSRTPEEALGLINTYSPDEEIK
jgi:hypothetical protein